MYIHSHMNEILKSGNVFYFMSFNYKVVKNSHCYGVFRSKELVVNFYAAHISKATAILCYLFL